ncbi:MAG: hypothetical protein QM768_23315 [Agriterribacter sp.]
MIEQSKGRIFVAEERGKNETGILRSLKTFNYGNFYNKNKEAFGNLYVLNDDTLAQKGSVKMLVEEESYVVFLPVAGALIYNDSSGYEASVAVGEILIRHILPGTIIHIENPFENYLINYLQLRFKPLKGIDIIQSGNISFDLDRDKNKLIHLTCEHKDFGFRLSIIKLTGRSEVKYVSMNNKSGIYAYAIEGALEVQYRLMQDRDGLALSELTEIEAEALSNYAILLIAEVSL